MATRVSYPFELKMKAIEMRLEGVPVREVMEQLGIRNKTQLKVWMKWYREGDVHRLEQPVGKQYSYGKRPEDSSELEKLQAENRFLKQQLDLLKKLPFGGKTLYLSRILDLFNGEIVAYSISDKRDNEFVLNTLGQLPTLSGAMLHNLYLLDSRCI